LRSRSHLDQFLVNTDKEDSEISRIVRETPHVLPETRIDDHDHIGGDECHLTQFYGVCITVQQGSEVGIVESIRGFRHEWEQDGSILQAGPQVHPVPFDVLPSPLSSLRVGGEGIRRGSEGEREMKFMVPMQFLSLILGGSTDSSVAEPNLRCFLVTTMVERPW
jgi:hypothetical protein